LFGESVPQRDVDDFVPTVARFEKPIIKEVLTGSAGLDSPPKRELQ
jgi:hypothetical protein